MSKKIKENIHRHKKHNTKYICILFFFLVFGSFSLSSGPTAGPTAGPSPT